MWRCCTTLYEEGCHEYTFKRASIFYIYTGIWYIQPNLVLLLGTIPFLLLSFSTPLIPASFLKQSQRRRCNTSDNLLFTHSHYDTIPFKFLICLHPSPNTLPPLSHPSPTTLPPLSHPFTSAHSYSFIQ